MLAPGVGQNILIDEGILRKIHGLAVASQRQRAGDADGGRRVVESRHIHSDSGKGEGLLLVQLHRAAMKSDLRLVQETGTETMSMGERKVPISAIGNRWESGGRGTAQLRGGQGGVLI